MIASAVAELAEVETRVECRLRPLNPVESFSPDAYLRWLQDAMSVMLGDVDQLDATEPLLDLPLPDPPPPALDEFD